MPISLLEIVDCGDGKVVLQRSGDNENPLVTILFSDETLVYLKDNGLEVARAMIQAGIQATAAISDRENDTEELSPSSRHILH